MARFVLVALVLVALGFLLPAPVTGAGPLGGFVMDSFEAVEGVDHYWTFHGHVRGWPAGWDTWVHVAGVANLDCAVDENGNFAGTVQLAADACGTVAATGVSTNYVMAIFSNTCYDTVD
jgi:hypothetical protein